MAFCFILFLIMVSNGCLPNGKVKTSSPIILDHANAWLAPFEITILKKAHVYTILLEKMSINNHVK